VIHETFSHELAYCQLEARITANELLVSC
jgi:hypothetical protein